MTARGAITVGFDGSADARRAAEWSAALAAPLGDAPLHLVHALALPAIPAHGWELGAEALLEQHEREMRALLESEQQSLARHGVPVELFVRRWLPTETLLEHARDHGSRLLVVGQGGQRPERLLLGSVSSAVARQAAIPVAVVRGREVRTPPAQVLLAADGSEPSLRAAAALALWLPAARIHAVHVRESAATKSPEAIAAELAGAGLDPARVEWNASDGPVAETLLQLAEEVDLVAAGRRGLSVWREILLGGVSEKLLQHAPCPVLVAH
jgi:nucleotide-binding universal stress UspA family protein